MEEWKYTKEQLETWRTIRLGILFVNTYRKMVEVEGSPIEGYKVKFKGDSETLRQGIRDIFEILIKRDITEKAQVLEQIALHASTLEEKLMKEGNTSDPGRLTPNYEEVLVFEKMIYDYTLYVFGRWNAT